MNGKFFKNIEIAKMLELKEEVNYAKGQVVSKTLVQTDNVSITLFSFDKGEEISSHSAAGDALVYVTEGDFIVMPANISHALEATEKFKMMLIVVKG